MSETADQLAERLRLLILPEVRGRLVARGLARGLIWRNGQLPLDVRPVHPRLTDDLLDHGYSLLTMALRLRDTQLHLEVVERALLVAGEAIESAIRRGAEDEPSRGFHLVVAAAAFHIGRYSSRSYCLVASTPATLNLSSPERLLVWLMRRDFPSLRRAAIAWLHDPTHSDERQAARLHDEKDDFDVDDLVSVALTTNFHRALAAFEHGLVTGDPSCIERARELLLLGCDGAESARQVSLWWASMLARHLCDDLWNQSLHNQLPQGPTDGTLPSWQEIRQNYISALSARTPAEVDLWPSQTIAAKRAIDPNDDLVVALPTSAGKTRIAELCILRTLADCKRAIYVTPLRALSAQVERTLAKTFRPLGFSVSALYGASGVAISDIGTLESSNIVVATPEKLDFAIRQKASVLDDVGLIVLDEGHMIGLGAREIRYEVLIQRLLRRPDAEARRLVCLSAIFSSDDSFGDFTQWLRADSPGDPVRSEWRPTRQRYGTIHWRPAGGWLQLAVDEEKPYVPRFVLPEPAKARRRNPFPQGPDELLVATTKALVTDGQRVLVFCPMRKSVEKTAGDFITLNRQGYMPNVLASGTDLTRALSIGTEWLGPDHVALQALRLGIGIHHAGLPRQFLSEVEELLNAKRLKVVVASPTLAQGIDLSCSALVLKSIYRGVEVVSSRQVRPKLIPPEEIANVMGRAGRAFVDLDGLTLYPIFESGHQLQSRMRDFQDLVRRSRTRTMESGIVELVGQLMLELRKRLRVEDASFAEYVLNNAEAWEVLRTPVLNEKDAEKQARANTALLTDLDSVILGAVEQLDIPTEELAGALDTALKSSLWQRRLARRDIHVQRTYTAVLSSRATWLWSKTTGTQRRGFFAAGIGYAAGRVIEESFDTLISDLLAADGALAAGNLTEALPAVERLSEAILAVHPFLPDEPFSKRQEVIRAWLQGEPVGQIAKAWGVEAIDFLQNGVIFRLVWGVEAVRSYALVKGTQTSDDFAGVLPLLLTFGGPNRQVALLVQAGIPTRRMALRLVNQFAPTYTTDKEMRQWLAEVATQLPPNFWSREEARLWQDFLGDELHRSSRAWTHARVAVPVRWHSDSIPPVGSIVRLVPDDLLGSVVVYTPEFTLLGVLLAELPGVNAGQHVARVAASLQHVDVESFGPTSEGLSSPF